MTVEVELEGEIDSHKLRTNLEPDNPVLAQIIKENVFPGELRNIAQCSLWEMDNFHPHENIKMYENRSRKIRAARERRLEVEKESR
jgi:hypothetical protein